MTTKIKPIPEGFHTFTACLTVRGAADALEFYKKAFGATELMRFNMPDGKIAHGEFKIGDSIFMIADENPECGSASPEALGR
ncbi:VOC family protein [Candidatus Methylobacter favarea]|nr:VOC family protein [Candidatus Methylobacter favarea]